MFQRFAEVLCKDPLTVVEHMPRARENCAKLVCWSTQLVRNMWGGGGVSKFRAGFRQNGFFFRGFLFLGRRILFADFFADFLAGFFLVFVGKSAQKNPPRKSLAKSSQIYATKSPTHFCRGAGPKMCRDCAAFVGGGGCPCTTLTEFLGGVPRMCLHMFCGTSLGSFNFE